MSPSPGKRRRATAVRGTTHINYVGNYLQLGPDGREDTPRGCNFDAGQKQLLFAKDDPDNAATYVSWHDAQEFVARLNAAGDRTYRNFDVGFRVVRLTQP